VWKGWEAGFWLSMLSILCHFHGLLFARATLGLQLDRTAQWAALARNCLSSLLSMSALAIMPQSRPYVHLRSMCAEGLTDRPGNNLKLIGMNDITSSFDAGVNCSFIRFEQIFFAMSR
jgi:hypothetical protein